MMHAGQIGMVGLVALLTGCFDSTPDGGIVPYADDSSELFDPTMLLTIEIQMAAADWEVVRKETRDFAGNRPLCPTGPFYSTYSYKRGTVTVNGKTVKDAGVRKRGFKGSVNSIKPSLKIKFDRFVEGQTLFGMERLTLTNNVQDPSHLRQCLNYHLARQAGLVAPRCNFAVVKVNGKELGLYSNVESVKKRFLARHFNDNDGDLFEGTVVDFREGFMQSFEPKTSCTDKTAAKIKAVAAALQVSDDKLMAALSPLVEIDNFATFWALNTLVGNSDSYFTEGNNFFVYFDPGTKHRMYFIPWGADAGFGAFGSEVEVFDVQARPILARRIYLLSAGQKKYIDALKALLAGVWNEARIKAEIDRMEKLIAIAAAKDLYMSNVKGDFGEAVKAVRYYVTQRRTAAQRVVAAPPTWTQGLPTQCR